MLLGFGDLSIFLAVTGCLAVTLFAVIYGACNWHSESDNQGKGDRK